MGTPVLGVRENVQNITSAMLRDWVEEHQVGNNLVIVGSGQVDHQQLADLTAKHFGDLATSGAPLANLDKPHYTPSLVFMRDDEMANVNTCVMFEAPSYAHEEAFAMYYF